MFKNLRPPLDDTFVRADITPVSPSPQGYTYNNPFASQASIIANHLGGLVDDWTAITAIRYGPLYRDKSNWKQQLVSYDIVYTFQTGSDRFGQGTDYINIYFRLKDGSNRLFVELTVGKIELYSYINSNLVLLQSVVQNKYNTVAPVSTHTMRVSVSVKNNIRVYLDDTLFINVDNSSLSTYQGFGVHQRANDGFGIELKQVRATA